MRHRPTAASGGSAGLARWAGAQLAVAIVLAGASIACGGGPQAEPPERSLVEPVAATGRSTPDQSPASTPPASDRADGDPVGDAPSSGGPAHGKAAEEPTKGDTTAELRRLVDDALLRYDRALTELAVDPLRYGAPGTAQRAAWDAAVLPGSYLSLDMLGSLVRRQQEERMVVVPPEGGISYVHRALLVEPGDPGVVSFTWCGWSPGTGIDVDSGVAVDVAVAHAHGSGRMRRVDGRWALEALDQLDLEVLPEGSPDPCPAEVQELGS